jgi:uncharacterized metal-binding protein YceD (DUF177 family)
MRGEIMPDTVGPLSRLVDVSNLPPHGLAVRVEANEEERSALARDFKLPTIRALVGEYRLKSAAKGVHVAGTVRAAITQVCVVSLDPFDSDLVEEVEVDFAESSGHPAEPPTGLADYDPPDEIVNGYIDLGAITAEFLALGLDPYPHKPGVDFAPDAAGEKPDSPFAALGSLKRDG